MGESVAEATITNWLKEVGDKVEADEMVLEIATDKVDSEVPSEVSGILIEKLFQKDDLVQVGQTIAIIETEGKGAVAVESSKQDAPAQAVAEVVKTVETAQQTVETDFSDSDKFFSPLVKNIAKEEGVSLSELESIKGTGKNERITKNDILEYLKNRGSQPVVEGSKQTSQPKAEPAKQAVPVSVNGQDEIIEMDRMRKLIAEHMVMSKHTSPHVTSFVEADVTNIVRWREKIKGSFQKQYEEKITYTPIFIEAIVKAIKDFPMVNISLDGDKILRKKRVNIGMAAALPSGNLIVPVIHDADQYNLVGLTRKVNDLASRAKANKLKPEEIQGGTFTLTNVGTFGNVMGTPIINQPQVAIMAAGAIRKRPAVLETPDGDVIAIRHMMFLSLSYDHRIVDGMLGGSFLKRVSDYLEGFDPEQSI